MGAEGKMAFDQSLSLKRRLNELSCPRQLSFLASVSGTYLPARRRTNF